VYWALILIKLSFFFFLCCHCSIVFVLQVSKPCWSNLFFYFWACSPRNQLYAYLLFRYRCTKDAAIPHASLVHWDPFVSTKRCRFL
jgi:hypothetical protein